MTAESLSSRSVESPSGTVPPPPQDDVMPPTHVSVSCVSSVGLAAVSGVPAPLLGVSDPLSGRQDQLRDRGDLGFTRHIVSADVHSIPRSISSFDPSLLFPFSDSGFSSLSSSAAPPLSSFSVASAPSLPSTSTVPISSLPSVVPSILSAPLPSAPPPSSFAVAPHPGFSSSVSYPSSSFLFFSSTSFPTAAFAAPFSCAPAPSRSSLPFSSSAPVSSFSEVRPVSSFSSASSPLDFVAYQANVLGLSAEYQALGRWYLSSGRKDFAAYLSAHFLHLYPEYRLDISSGSSRFLSAPPLVQVPAAPEPFPLVSSALPPSFSVPSASFSLASSFSGAALPFFRCPVAPAPFAQLPPQAPAFSYPLGFRPQLSSSPSPLLSSSGFPAVSSHSAAVAAELGFPELSDFQGVS